MKYILTEKQFKNIILEQPDEKFDAPWNKEFMRTGKLPDNIPTLGIDDTIDIISAAIDGIPGIGNLVSAGIDVTHAISYCIRLYYTDDDDINKKIEYATLAFITLGAAAIPIQGNSLPIIFRQGLSKTLSHTPSEILSIAQKMGLYNKTVIFLKKSKWEYSLLILLCKILGGEISENLEVVNKKLYSIYNNFKKYPSISNPILTMINDINDIKSDIPLALELSKKL